MVDGSSRPPALQVIVLGSGGGPDESNCSTFLIRSIALQWRPGSVLSLDAGVQVGAITRIFEKTLLRKNISKSLANPSFVATDRFTIGTVLDDGPFKGFTCQAETPWANAAYFMRKLIDTYLITHPHMDHIGGMVTSSPSVWPFERPKKLAGLPGTIEALKRHIFNDLIWPNLSDEGHGVGFFHYVRLKDGGTGCKGEISDTAYTEVVEGISTFPRSLSHGLCQESPPFGVSEPKPSCIEHGNQTDPPTKTSSRHGPWPWLKRIIDKIPWPFVTSTENHKLVYDSTAYFVKDNKSGTEILVFGDMEPDTESHLPRNKRVWIDAAPKVRAGTLKAIFMECSWDSSNRGDLYGHMSPPFVMEELQVLACLISSDFKPKKIIKTGKEDHPEYVVITSENQTESTTTNNTVQTALSDISNDRDRNRERSSRKPLDGVSVVIIHMKEKMDDGPCIRELVGRELREFEKDVGLGCEFIISEAGMSLEF